MHSFHPSRGRIFFEVLCALGFSASLAGAWMQTGATALLPAAGVAALYGLVHLFDMRRPKPAEAPRSAEAAEPQRIAFEPEAENDLADQPTPIVPFVAETLPAEDLVQVAALPEPTVLQPKESRKAKAPRKSGSRKASAAKAVDVAELLPPEVVEFSPPEVAEVAPPDDVAELAPPEEVAEFVLPEDEEFADFDAPEDSAHSPIAPLFEPEPFARMQRRAFGRRGRI